jgi:hypothetical protein
VVVANASAESGADRREFRLGVYKMIEEKDITAATAQHR